jgi:hypothetical protein
MVRVLLVQAFLVFSSLTFAQTVTAEAPATAKSWLEDDIFFQRTHVNKVGAPDSQVPDTIPIGAIRAVVRVWVPTNQDYTRFFFITDKEGKLVNVAQSSGPLTTGFNVLTTTFDALPTAGASGGQYKFICLVIGANGIAAFSPYFEFRQSQP